MQFFKICNLRVLIIAETVEKRNDYLKQLRSYKNMHTILYYMWYISIGLIGYTNSQAIVMLFKHLISFSVIITTGSVQFLCWEFPQYLRCLFIHSYSGGTTPPPQIVN